ncbi:hypothetical protein EVAR_87893_1 [Eumeta japonica]|uniref:Uncharacterized protein n=1 Tax=Eumeta variegata TaxID=151549 RepID=A0A4C1WVB4_EUMVA|nr:hypothetical protein EVAR_87893_1 [Eumeta japonica]
MTFIGALHTGSAHHSPCLLGCSWQTWCVTCRPQTPTGCPGFYPGSLAVVADTTQHYITRPSLHSTHINNTNTKSKPSYVIAVNTNLHADSLSQTIFHNTIHKQSN